ncbi:hypothetical protein ElyMa_006537900 [Elysia marginata]|uniref:Reelin domain-containing protein n=1 Tax=Elysia marginata TaxID=1093978 RepID=A0AAV4I9M3_9GAST|nr:hypothetical protein ElyMa_006537900 [Elysia marginata]
MKVSFLCHSYDNKNPSRKLHIAQSSVLEVSLFLFCSLLAATTEGFGQGTMIENSFESTYCRDGVSALSRGPAHYDLQRCGGQCRPSRAPRDMYRLLVNTTTYSVDNVQVELRANSRQGANLLGFAVVAITEDGGTAGRWVVDEEAEEPEVLRATCDSLLEGQVIFQAQPSQDRTRVRVVWNPRKTNYGSVIFRAWIVQSVDAIFVVDSPPLTNPLDGREFMEIEHHFRDLLDAMTVARPQKPPSTSQPATPNASRRNPGAGKRNPTRNRTMTRANQVAKGDGVSRKNTTASSSTRRDRGQGETVSSDSFTMEHFEDAFLARMASGFDLSRSDPFSDFDKETIQMSDLVPHHDAPPEAGGLNSSAGLGPITNIPEANAGNHPSRQRPNSRPSDVRIPRSQEPIPQTDGGASRAQPTMSGGPRQVLPLPTQAQQPDTLSALGLAPGNPFARFQSMSVPMHNRFPTNMPPPMRNSAFFGLNRVFAGGASRQPLPGIRGSFGNSRNMPQGSNLLPGFNTPFMARPNPNQWGPNWNTGANWGFQNGVHGGFVPGWNSGQNLAGWNRNLAGSNANQFTPNLNMGPNQIPQSINFNTNPPAPGFNTRLAAGSFGQNIARPNANLASINVGSAQPVVGPNNNADSSTQSNAGRGGLGSFSELLHAVGGWGRK